MCYNYQNGIIDEEDIMFVIELESFLIGMISLLEIIQSMETTNVEIMDTSDKTSNLELKSGVQITKQKTTGNIYELEVALENKVHPETYYNHQPRSVVVDKTPTRIKT